MSGFEAIISEIRQRGTQAISLGEEAGQVDLAGAVEGVAAALPGSTSAEVVHALQGAWSKRIQTLSEDMAQHGEAMVAAADEYERSEEAAQENIQLLPDGHMRPV